MGEAFPASADDYAQAAAQGAHMEAQNALSKALDLEKRIARLELVFGLDKLERIMPLDSIVLPRHRYEKIHLNTEERDRIRRGFMPEGINPETGFPY